MDDIAPGVDERLKRLLQRGEDHAAGALSIILYDLTPPFIMNVKGRKSVYDESREAATAILKQELSKGNDNLFNRLKHQIDSYWG